MTNIAVIGAGLSGTLLAVNLLKSKTDSPVNIKLIDPCKEDDLGPAFSTRGDYLLNVRAAIMGAESDPEHFWRWLNANGIQAEKTDFLPRKIYRRYIKELFSNALKQKKKNISFERIQAEVTDIMMKRNQASVVLEDGRIYEVDKVALALGNFPPRNPPLNDHSFITSDHYISNPWKMDMYAELPPVTELFFIGTGQTTVDIAAGLYKNGHKAKMFAISRRGLLPMVHKIADAYPAFDDELKNLKSALELCRVVRRHIKKAESSSYDSRAVIDSLRPYTQELWMNLSTDEKEKFNRHLFRYWEVIRSRIPDQTDTIIKQMQSNGQLSILTGTITAIKIKENGLEVHFTERHTGKLQHRRADLVLNCMGPETDYTKAQNTLVRNLLSKGLIEPGPAKLGMNALPDGTVIHKDGTASGVLFTIGSPLKGILWETLAAPEIRMQAANLAHMMLNGN